MSTEATTIACCSSHRTVGRGFFGPVLGSSNPCLGRHLAGNAVLELRLCVPLEIPKSKVEQRRLAFRSTWSAAIMTSKSESGGEIVCLPCHGRTHLRDGHVASGYANGVSPANQRVDRITARSPRRCAGSAYSRDRARPSHHISSMISRVRRCRVRTIRRISLASDV